MKRLELLDLVDNRIRNIDALRNMSEITWLYLSNNSIRDIEPIKHLVKLKELSLSYNKIERIQPLSNLTNLKFLNISFNNVNLSLTNESLYRLTNLKKAFIDKKLIVLFDKMVNKNIKKRNVYTFLYSIFIVTEDDLDFHNCSLTLDFIKRNVHLNLYYWNQIDSFLDKCGRIDLDLQF
jgi:Leucine-rich repeat (LRR) protein